MLLLRVLSIFIDNVVQREVETFVHGLFNLSQLVIDIGRFMCWLLNTLDEATRVLPYHDLTVMATI